MRSRMTAGVALATALGLLWQYVTVGVGSHHLFAQEYLPAVSNWWGILTLPALAWIGLGSLEQRLAKSRGDAAVGDFIGACAFGLAMAVFYSLERADLCEYLLQCLFLLALFYPVYRLLSVLGFVFGMVFAFGPVVPLAMALPLAALGYVLHHGLRLLTARVGAIFR